MLCKYKSGYIFIVPFYPGQPVGAGKVDHAGELPDVHRTQGQDEGPAVQTHAATDVPPPEVHPPV